MNTITPRVGQIVEFHSSHPSLPHGGAVVRGTVSDCTSWGSSCPRNPTVQTPYGGVELLARWWGNRVQVVG